MEQEIVKALDQILMSNIWSLMLSFIAGATLLMTLKVVSEAITGHIQFILDKYIAVGSLIEIFGKQGRIKTASIFTVTVETECGYIRIPFKDFRSSRYVLLKDRGATIKEE